MVNFVKSYLSGLGHEETDTWDNILLEWIKNNWTLTSPAKWHQQDNPFGVIFGTSYVGEFDYVCYTKIENDNFGETESTALGGRMDKLMPKVTFIFSVRKYDVSDEDEIPVDVTTIHEFIEDLFDNNPTALKSEGIRRMWLTTVTNGQIEVNAQQIFQMKFLIQLIISKTNFKSDEI